LENEEAKLSKPKLLLLFYQFPYNMDFKCTANQIFEEEYNPRPLSTRRSQVNNPTEENIMGEG
jgi:hypothetical protein